MKILCAENTLTFDKSSYKGLICKAGSTNTLNVTDGAFRVTPLYVVYSKNFFSYADMLPVMVFMSFMSILYIIVTKSQV